MSRLVWILVALCALSCNASVSARTVVRDPSSAPAVVSALEPIPDAPKQAPPGFARRKPRESDKPTALLAPSDCDAGDVTLCCDRPTGICYHDDGGLCQASTSHLVTCPAVAVRDFDIEHGFVMCAD